MRGIWKRCLSLLLVFATLFAIVPTLGITATAATLGEYDIYEAAELARENGYELFFSWYHTIMSTTSKDEALDEYCDILLYHHFADGHLKSNVSVGAKAIWSSINTDLQLVEEDIYTALLLKMIAGDFEKPEDTSLLKELFEGTKTTLGFVENLCEKLGIERSQKALNAFFAACDAKAADKTKDKLWHKFVEACDQQGLNSKNWDTLGTFLDILGWIWDTTETYYEVVDRVEEIVYIMDADQAYCTVLAKMASTTDNLWIRASAVELYNVLRSDQYTKEKLDRIEKIAKGDVTEKFGKDTVAVTLKGVISLINPALYSTIAVVDIFVGVSQEVASTYTMCAMAEMEKAIFEAVAAIREDFRVNQGQESAAAYQAGLNMCYTFAYQTCYYIDDHLEAVFKKGLAKEVFRNQESYTIYKNIVAEARSHILTSYQNAIDNPMEAYKQSSDAFVMYDAMGGMNEPGVQTKSYSGQVTISSVRPTRSGYTFKGWALGSPSSYMTAYPGYTVSFPVEGDWKFYAVWEQNTYGIAFHANGGQGGPTNALKKGGEPLVLPTETPTYEGKKFLGWALNPSATEPDFYAGGKLEFDSALNLYAVWGTVSHTISFNANGGSGAPSGQKIENGSATIPATEPTKSYHTFLGWATSANATTAKYAPNDTITGLTGSLTLYAVWAPKSFNVVFDANGGAFANGQTTITKQKLYNQSFTFDVEEPKLTGSNFLGWKLKDGTKVFKTNDTVTDIDGKSGLATRTLYAVWQPTSALFTYDYSNSKTYDTLTLPLADGKTQYTLLAPKDNLVAEAGNREFLYWKYLNSNGTWTTYDVGDTITVTGKTTVYAEWASSASAPTLSIITDQQTYQPGDVAALKITANNTGYFRVNASDAAGFKVKAVDGSKQTSSVFVEKASASSASSLKCYNNGSSYTVYVYIPSGCQDGNYSIKVAASNGVYDASLDGCAPGTETGWTSETVTIKVDTTVPEEDVPSVCFLSYDLNYGSGTIPATQKFEAYDHIVLASESGFERVGYKFKGWCENENGNGKVYKAGKDYQFGESKLLYAKWEAIENYGQLYVTSTMERYSKVYKPGESAAIVIAPDYTNHLYVSVKNCPGVTLTNAAGNTKAVDGIWVEKTSPDYDGTSATYSNNGNLYVTIHIPKNCPDGEYTYIVRAANGRRSGDSSDGDVVEASGSFFVRSSDKADGITLSKNELTLHLGSERSLEATVEPYKIFNHYNKKTVSWKTSNKSVASIDTRGNKVDIFGGKTGTATVTATVDSVSASCKVTVVNCDYCLKDIDPDYLASAATCTEQATYYYICSCGNTGSNTYKYGGLAAHEYSSWTTIVEPGEYNVGMKQKTCSVCGDVVSETIPALGHTHTKLAEWYADDEQHWKECAGIACTDKLDLAKHVFENDEDADCNVCGYERVVHKFSPEWSADDTNHWHVCSCGEKCDIAPHEYGNWRTYNDKYHTSSCVCGKSKTAEHNWDGGSVTKQPTETEAGIKTYTCEDCRGTRVEVIPKLESDQPMTLSAKVIENTSDGILVQINVSDTQPIVGSLISASYNDNGKMLGAVPCAAAETVSVKLPAGGTLVKVIWMQEDTYLPIYEPVLLQLGHSHKPNMQWSSNETNHWHECTGSVCREKLDFAVHVDTSADGLCDVCGYLIYTPIDESLLVDGEPSARWDSTSNFEVSRTFSVSSELPWQVSCDAEWIEIEPSQDELSLVMMKNYSESRSTTVQLTNGVTTTTIEVNQGEAEAAPMLIYPVLSEDEKNPTGIPIGGLYFETDYREDNNKYSLAKLFQKGTSGDWEEIFSGELDDTGWDDWVEVREDLLEVDGIYKLTLYGHYSAEYDKYELENQCLEKSWYFQTKNSGHYLTINGTDYLEYDAWQNSDIPDLTILSSNLWTWSSDVDWISVSYSSSYNRCNGKAKIKLSSNYTDMARTGTVTFTNGYKTAVLQIHQQGAKPKWIYPENVSQDINNPTVFAYDELYMINWAQVSYFECYENGQWVEHLNAEDAGESELESVWYSKSTITSNFEDNTLYRYTLKTGEFTEQYYFKFDSATPLKYLHLTDKTSFSTFLRRDCLDVTMSAGGGTKSIILRANAAWAISSNASWLSTSSTSGSATSKKSVTITAAENKTGADRTGTLSFKLGGKEYATIQVKQVGQDRIQTYIEYGQSSNYRLYDPQTDYLHLDGSRNFFDVYAQSICNYSVVSNDSWITVDDESKLSDIKPGKAFTVELAEYTDNNTARTGSITISCGKASQTVYLTQEPRMSGAVLHNLSLSTSKKTPTVRKHGDLTLTWSSIEGAEIYEICVNPEDKSLLISSFYSFEQVILDDGSANYSITIPQRAFSQNGIDKIMIKSINQYGHRFDTAWYVQNTTE